MAVPFVDDDKNIVTALQLLLKNEHLPCVACTNPADALDQIQEQSFQLGLIDLNYNEDTTSGKEGLELISKIRQIDPDLPLIVMTGWGTVGVAVEAMKRGAKDFVEKPWDDNNRLVTAIRTQIQLKEIAGRENRLREENKLLKRERSDSGELICHSVAMKDVLELVERVAASDIPLLITGENGTGKSLLANHIHGRSARAGEPFVSVNMGGISSSTFESEMFGHVKGAFTDAKSDRIGRVELADGGTLFMDEIANMPLDQQPKILRLLEEFQYERLGSSRSKTASLRVISATNAELDTLVAEHGFRQDLLYRLNGVTIRLPPLRERPDDVVPLAENFLAKALANYKPTQKTLSAEAERRLCDYSWPGNVRELQHVIERAVLLSRADEISIADLQLPETVSATDASLGDDFFAQSLEEVEHWYLQSMLERLDGNATRAAKVLGISRSALYRRLGKSHAKAPKATEGGA